MIQLLPTNLMQKMISIYQVCTVTKDVFVLSKDANHLSLCVETTTSNPTWLEKIQKTVKSILQAVNLIQTTPVDKLGKPIV